MKFNIFKKRKIKTQIDRDSYIDEMSAFEELENNEEFQYFYNGLVQIISKKFNGGRNIDSFGIEIKVIGQMTEIYVSHSHQV